MSKFTGNGGGKLILMGEHAVVYGKPAIGMNLDRGIEAALTAIDKGPPTVELDQRGFAAFVSAAAHAGLDPGRFNVAITSSLPVGQGLGSSAALSVALGRAMLAALGREETDEKVIELAHVMETVFHGSPSGMDARLALGRGPLLFRKGEEPETLRVGAAVPIVVLTTESSPSTKVMVRRVREQYEKNPKKISGLMDHIENLVLEAGTFIQKGHLYELGRAMNENHGVLWALGVSTGELDSLREKALKAGSPGAKLTGGGGGGAVICLAGDRDHADRLLQELKIEDNSFVTMLR
ncbi:MAG: mevalonate kinase [Pseudomonadota bacterium]